MDNTDVTLLYVYRQINSVEPLPTTEKDYIQDGDIEDKEVVAKILTRLAYDQGLTCSKLYAFAKLISPNATTCEEILTALEEFLFSVPAYSVKVAANHVSFSAAVVKYFKFCMLALRKWLRFILAYEYLLNKLTPAEVKFLATHHYFTTVGEAAIFFDNEKLNILQSNITVSELLNITAAMSDTAELIEAVNILYVGREIDKPVPAVIGLRVAGKDAVNSVHYLRSNAVKVMGAEGLYTSKVEGHWSHMTISQLINCCGLITKHKSPRKAVNDVIYLLGPHRVEPTAKEVSNFLQWLYEAM